MNETLTELWFQRESWRPTDYTAPYSFHSLLLPHSDPHSMTLIHIVWLWSTQYAIESSLIFNKMCVPALMLGDLTFVLGLKRNFDSLEHKQVSMKIEPNLEKVWFFYWSMHIITLPKKKDILDRSHKFQSSPFQIQMWYRKMRNNLKRIKKN